MFWRNNNITRLPLMIPRQAASPIIYHYTLSICCLGMSSIFYYICIQAAVFFPVVKSSYFEHKRVVFTDDAPCCFSMAVTRTVVWLFYSQKNNPEGNRYHQGLYSLSRRTSCCEISGSLEAARFVFKISQSLRNLTGISAATLPRCLSNFIAIRSS